MGRKQVVDKIFKNFFLVVSTFSVIALIAIIVFVFAQGAVPFLTSTADNVHLIPFGIEEFTINGTPYKLDDLPRTEKFVELDEPSGAYTVGFVNKGETVAIDLDLDLENDIVRDRVKIRTGDGGEVEYAEEYVFEVTYKGTIAGQLLGFYIAIPQTPTNFFSEFFFAKDWRPTYNKQYGILTMIVATILSTLGAVIIGVPLGLLTAVYMADFVPSGIGRYVRGGIDLLAGIPSVVYGFFGLMMVVPLIKEMSGASSGGGLLAAIFILAIMMLPTVISISETTLRSVPMAYREGSLALGATKMQTAWRVVFPAAKSGILASIILGTSRAVGETMAVIMVAGNSPQMPGKLTDGIRTLTATIALEMGYAQGRHNRILFSVGIVLFLMILILNTLILVLKKRLTEEQ
ncbi:MAG: phosphate ABC transporter permease subunit PstC [Spirochaetaceae bacterium]|nr:phosphate ABC transporter permease subunit PstC [Spirochaetaceae bacterium]